MKRVTLTNKTHYLIDEDTQAKLLQAIDKGAKYVVLQGDVIMVASIIGIQDEAIFEELEHRKNLDYQCVHGRWHGRDDKCYGHDAPLNRGQEAAALLGTRYHQIEDKILGGGVIK